MIVYLVESKVPDIDLDTNVQAESSLKAAKKKFTEVKSEIIELKKEGWCSLRKIELTDSLTNKQLILAIFSGRGFASNQETLKEWSSDRGMNYD